MNTATASRIDVGVPAAQIEKKFVEFVIESHSSVSKTLASRIEDELLSELYWNDNICARDVFTDVTNTRVFIRTRLYGAGIEVEAGKPVTSSYSREKAYETFENVVQQNMRGIKTLKEVRIAILDGDAPQWRVVPLTAAEKMKAAFIKRGRKLLGFNSASL